MLRGKLKVTSNDWQRLDFTLTPNARTTAGRFALKLKQPGSIVLGHAFLQPGEWGRFKGLPVRRDVAEGLIKQGITVLRYGGSMVNNGGLQVEEDDRAARSPATLRRHVVSRIHQTAGAFSTSWISARPQASNMSPTFNMGETPQDMADFIEYAKGPADSEWGRKRVADGHPQPYTAPLHGTRQRRDASTKNTPKGSRRSPRPSGPKTET